jgi:hypothetical protein
MFGQVAEQQLDAIVQAVKDEMTVELGSLINQVCELGQGTGFRLVSPSHSQYVSHVRIMLALKFQKKSDINRP